MSRLGTVWRKALDRGVHGAARVGYALSPAARPERYGVELVRNVPYRPSGRRAHRLDVYRPRASGPRPAVLYVHGGGFAMLSKDTHRLFALALAARGYVVFNIDYRLAPRHPYPAPLEDAAMALLWVLDHGRMYGADGERLALAGESAGANLVATLAYCATNRRGEPFARAVYDRAPALRAVLPIYGIHDMHDLDRFAHMPWFVRDEVRFVVWAYVGGTRERDARLAPLASPLRRYEEPPGEGARPLPPFFAACGTADPVLGDSKRMKAAIEARGGTFDLHVYPGEVHGFDAMLWRPAARAKWQALYAFLERHLE